MRTRAKNAIGEVKDSLICAAGKLYFAAVHNSNFSMIRKVENTPKLTHHTLSIEHNQVCQTTGSGFTVKPLCPK